MPGILQDIGAGINWFGNCVERYSHLYAIPSGLSSGITAVHERTVCLERGSNAASLENVHGYQAGTGPNVLCQHELIVIFVSTTLRQLVVLHD
jgi:hypothetical protein